MSLQPAVPRQGQQKHGSDKICEAELATNDEPWKFLDVFEGDTQVLKQFVLVARESDRIRKPVDSEGSHYLRVEQAGQTREIW